MAAFLNRNRARRSSRPTRISKTSGKSCRRQRSFVDHIGTFKRLAQLYAAVRNAYADKIGFVADLAYKTRQLVEQNATQDGPRPPDQERHLRCEDARSPALAKRAPTKARSSTSFAGLQKEIDDDADAAPVLQPLKDRAERILKDLENRNTTGLAAMDLLAALAAEKDAAAKAAKDTGLTPKAFAAFWALRDNPVLKSSGIDPLELAREIEKLLARFPNAKVNRRRTTAAARVALSAADQSSEGRSHRRG